MNGDQEDISNYPAAVRRAILIESGNTAAMSVGGKSNRRNGQGKGPVRRPGAGPGQGALAVRGPTIRTDLTFGKDQFCSVSKEVFDALAQCGCAEAPLTDARVVALSSSHNKSFLEPPYSTPPMRLHHSVIIMYITGEHMLKDRFLCARYVMHGSEFQPRIVNHTAPGPLQGTYVERPSTGPLGRGCRVISNPISWYAPGRVLQQVPPQPLLHEKKLVVVTACCLVRGDGSVYLSSSGGAMLLDAQKMAAQDPETVPLSTIGMDTRCLVPALVDLFTRFFDKPFAAQPQGVSQARLFRVDGWMASNGRVHSIELHSKNLKDIVNSHGPPQAVVEMAQALVEGRASDRLRIATVKTRSLDEPSLLHMAQSVNERITRLMTAGDVDDPHLVSFESKQTLSGSGNSKDKTSAARKRSSETKSPLRRKRKARRGSQHSHSDSDSDDSKSTASSTLSELLSGSDGEEEEEEQEDDEEEEQAEEELSGVRGKRKANDHKSRGQESKRSHRERQERSGASSKTDFKESSAKRRDPQRGDQKATTSLTGSKLSGTSRTRVRS